MIPNLVRFDDGRLLTRNLAPGVRVYDEELHDVQGAEHRTWNPMRSKLGSYLIKGGRNLELDNDSVVLYLGAANGTTPSHVSDIVRDGVLVAVEFSPRSFRDLLRVAGNRPNMVPVLADAWRPELYDRYLGKVDLLFQDIAQRQQAAIFAKNLERFQPALAIIAVKARSVDVAAHPRDVYEAVGREIVERTGYELIESVDLGPFEKDHAALVLVPGRGGKPDAAKRDVRAEHRGGPREGGFQRRDDRGGGGFQRRDDRGGGFQRRDDRGGGFQRRDDRGGGYQRRDDRGGGGGYQRRDEGPRPYDKKERPGGWQKRDDKDKRDRPKWR